MNRNGQQVLNWNAAAAASALLSSLLLFVFAVAAVPAKAQTPTTLHTFANVSTDACEPEDNIVQAHRRK